MNERQFLDWLKTHSEDLDRPRFDAIASVHNERPTVTEQVNLSGRVFKHPVHIANVDFTEFVDLAGVQCEGSLRIENCTFKNGLRLADGRVNGVCSLRQSTFEDHAKKWLDFRRLHVDGLLDCTLMVSKVCVSLENAKVGSDAWFHSVTLLSAIGNEEVATKAASTWDNHEEQSACLYLIGKSLHMEGASIENNLYFHKEGGKPVVVHGQIDLRVKVGITVEFIGATVNAGIGKNAVVMDAADVGGSVFFLQDTKVTGQIDLRAKVGGQVNFEKATVNAGVGKKAVIMDAAEVGGSVFFLKGTKVTGQIDLRANVGRTVEFEGATVNAGVGKKAVDMESAEVGGSVFFRSSTRIIGNINMLNAVLRNGIWTCSTANLVLELPRPNAHGRELIVAGNWDLRFARVTGPIVIHRTSLFGDIFARQLHVEGDFDVCGSVVGPGKFPKHLLEGKIEKKGGNQENEFPNYSAFPELWHVEETSRTVEQDYGSRGFATLYGNLFSKFALDLELAQIRGRLWCKGTKFLGTVYLEDTEVDGEANFEKGEVHGDLILRSSIVKGRVFADEGSSNGGPYPKVKGHVDLSFARVQQIDIRFHGQKDELTPDYVDLTGTEAETIAFARETGNGKPQPSDPRPWIVVDGTKFGKLEVKEGTFANTRPARTLRDWFRLAFVGTLIFMTLVFAFWLGNVWLGRAAILFIAVVWWHSRTLPSVRDEYLNFLARTHPFNPGFFLKMEQWLRANGDDATADEVFHMRRRRESGETHEDRLRVWQKKDQLVVIEKFPKVFESNPSLRKQPLPPSRATWLWLAFVEFVSGYGVRTSRLVCLYLLLWMVNAGVFLEPRSVERPIQYVQMRTDSIAKGTKQVDPEKMTQNPWRSDGGVPDKVDNDGKANSEWSLRQSFFVSMRLQIPVLSLIAEKDWDPASREMTWFPWITYQDYGSIMMVINLILIPLMIAGATGYLKKV